MATFDPFRASYLENPYPSIVRLRREDPVHFSKKVEGWVVSRHEDARTVLMDVDRFGNDPGTASMGLGAHVAATRRHSPLGHVPLLGSSDPPVHTRLRSIISKLFTPRRMEASRPQIREQIDELLDNASALPRADFMSKVAHPLPVHLVGGLLGLTSQDRVPVRQWTSAVMRVIGGGNLPPAAYREAEDATAKLRVFLDSFADTHEGDSVLASLVAAEADPDRLSADEGIAFLTFLYQAGGGPTAMMLGNAVLTLLRHPDQWEQLREDPSLVRSALLETLRWDSATHVLLRFAREDTTLGKRTIKAGDTMFVLIVGAHRDPDLFPDPDRFDITREVETTDVLSFGLGPHFCLGQPLALIQGEEVLKAMMERFPDVALPRDGLTRSKELLLRGPQRMELTWS